MIIAIVGFGYWGQLLYSIVNKLGYKVDYIISSGQDTSCNSFSRSKFLIFDYQNSSYICDLVSNYNISHLFICTGPIVQDLLINSLQHSYLTHISIWAEKPYTYCSIPHNLFIDYPYVFRNSVQPLFQSPFIKSIDLSLYSKRQYNRPHSIRADFLPHLSSIIFSVFNPPSVESVKAISHSTEGSNIYSAQFSIDSNISVQYNYGISQLNDSTFSYILFNGDHFSFRLSDLFYLPVNSNIKLFLSGLWRNNTRFHHEQRRITAIDQHLNQVVEA